MNQYQSENPKLVSVLNDIKKFADLILSISEKNGFEEEEILEIGHTQDPSNQGKIERAMINLSRVIIDLESWELGQDL